MMLFAQFLKVAVMVTIYMLVGSAALAALIAPLAGGPWWLWLASPPLFLLAVVALHAALNDKEAK